eukprot:NODE_470_length_3017_cov_3.997232.p1 GENE.NODE_470_length_3017_cov_3.997232~~NODE_470_length_3017_cov_3.997232.p1  ORF type:complete len:774 (+),score=209.75 NODE_470_length_3017_cov_3.997232:212-2533(+)
MKPPRPRRPECDGGATLAPVSLEDREAPVSAVLAQLAPHCSPAVYERLQRERVRTAAELAVIDHEDLRELGLTMLERAAVYRWAAKLLSQPVLPARTRMRAQSRAPSPTRTPPLHDDEEEEEEEDDTSGAVVRRGSSLSLGLHARKGGKANDSAASPAWRLDEAKADVEFWIGLSRRRNSGVLHKPPRSTAEIFSLSPSDSSAATSDLRESVIEKLFDVSQQRVMAVFKGLHAAHGALSLFSAGLQQCGLPVLDDEVLASVVRQVVQDPARVKIEEFEAAISRLKLAELLEDKSLAQAQTTISVFDYTRTYVEPSWFTQDPDLRRFFFGHREWSPLLAEPPVRWVHLPFHRTNVQALLAITVKYGLHPLSVADVIGPCSAKFERLGEHYFLAMSRLSLVEEESVAGGDRVVATPLRVHASHVSLFCSGAPHYDTLISIVQRDTSFGYEWRGASFEAGGGEIENAWVRKVQDRLHTKGSRLRERRADVLLHQIVDLSADDLVGILRAYDARLACIRHQVDQRPCRGRMNTCLNGNHTASLGKDWLQEVKLAQLQVGVVLRRIRSLRRVVVAMMDDTTFVAGSLKGYLQNVVDHLDGATEAGTQTLGRCTEIVENLRSDFMRRSEVRKNCRLQWMDRTLFVLVIGSAAMEPLLFSTALYGMNFHIPELLSPSGYQYFWTFVICYVFSALVITFVLYRRFRKCIDHLTPHPTLQRAVDALITSLPSSASLLMLPQEAALDARRYFSRYEDDLSTEVSPPLARVFLSQTDPPSFRSA